MTILNEDKIKKFKEKLYTKNVSMLLKQGGKGLTPLEKYKKDDKGRTLVSTREITHFFLRQMEKAGSPFAYQYVTALFNLLQTMSRGAEPIAFDCGFSISLEDIQEADNKTTIKLLTTNIIITYFNTLKTYKGTVDTSLLSPDLKALIAKSNAGRDYKDMIDNTLTGLNNSLGQDKPWRDYLEDLNDVDLICRLAGAKLPAMKNETIAGIIGKSRREILGYNDIFTKILLTRGQLAAKEGNKKIFLKSMEKLDAAIFAILKKTENYLASAHRLMGILHLSHPIVLGKTDAQLRQNMVWLFLDTKPGKKDRTESLNDLGITLARYRLNLLFNYPEITRYCRSFKTTEEYGLLYFDLFRLLFKEVSGKIALLEATTQYTGLSVIHQNLREISGAVSKLGLEEADLKDEKQALRDTYVALIPKVDVSQLGPIMKIIDLICQATQDRTREIMSSIRPALITACASNLSAYAEETPGADTARNGIKKRLNAYAVHYKPQREFYQIFFDTCVGSGTRPVSSHLAGLINTNKPFAAALLMVYSDETVMKDLISADRISHAAALLDQIRQNT